MMVPCPHAMKDDAAARSEESLQCTIKHQINTEAHPMTMSATRMRMNALPVWLMPWLSRPMVCVRIVRPSLRMLRVTRKVKSVVPSEMRLTRPTCSHNLCAVSHRQEQAQIEQAHSYTVLVLPF